MKELKTKIQSILIRVVIDTSECVFVYVYVREDKRITMLYGGKREWEMVVQVDGSSLEKSKMEKDGWILRRLEKYGMGCLGDVNKGDPTGSVSAIARTLYKYVPVCLIWSPCTILQPDWKLIINEN